MFINLKECTVTPPIDCQTPPDRLKRVPVARSDSDKPIALTERLWRMKLSLRFYEIRELESEGPIPLNPEKVKELHYAAINFKKSLPSYYQGTNPDTRWDAECPFLVTHRELFVWLIESFLASLHRPYIFTREHSQLQVYKSSLAALDSQDRWFQMIQGENLQWLIGLTFPTFDSAALLAVVLVSNPERYQTDFPRALQKLKNAQERLSFIGATMALAKSGSEILQAVLTRVLEARERVGLPIPNEVNVSNANSPLGQHQGSISSSSDGDPWQFEVDQTAMDWTIQNPEFSEFDFSNLEVPMPLKELLLDEEMAALSSGVAYDPNLWMSTPDLQGMESTIDFQGPVMDASENSLWNFLTDTKLYYS